MSPSQAVLDAILAVEARGSGAAERSGGWRGEGGGEGSRL